MFFGFDLTQAIEVLGYPGIFAIVLAESGLFFGVSLPGGSLLFTAGLLASQGLMNLGVLCAVVLVAAVLGDAIGYWFGSWVGPALWRRPESRFFKKRYLEQTKDFFDKHGTRTIFLARFIPIIRTFAPIVAGVTQMHYRTFFTYNVLGAVVWGGGYTVAGYLLGETVPNIEEYLEFIVIGIIFITMIPFVWHVYSSRKKSYTAQMHEGGLLAPESLEKELPKAVIFDLDDTLTESFQPPTQKVLDDLARLIQSVPVAIMSAAAYSRIERDVMHRLPDIGNGRFYVFSDSTAECHAWEGGAWREKYNRAIDPEERRRIRGVLEASAREANVMAGAPDTSRILLDRETSVAWTALHPDATQHEKRSWDPTGKKRQAVLEIARNKLPEYEVLIGGKTSIDVLHKGISKAYGVEWLAKELDFDPKQMLFIGDAFYESGNDAAVIPTGIQTMETSGPKETHEIIDGLLRKFSN